MDERMNGQWPMIRTKKVDRWRFAPRAEKTNTTHAQCPLAADMKNLDEVYPRMTTIVVTSTPSQTRSNCKSCPCGGRLVIIIIIKDIKNHRIWLS